ncbi:MAG: SulP family inorganic anion transporter [Magnetococcales bacterium]|nr:SulP family inorganic anion transporter [Magnetococcales bacterium]
MSGSIVGETGFSWRIFVPPLLWWHRVTPAALRSDLMAGLTGAIVVIPQGVAFATIAGMPPVYGLYAGMIPAIVAAFFGSSWHLVSGPTTAASIVLYSLLSVHAEPGSVPYVQLALTMTFLVGLAQLALGVARMGTLVNFISHSVVIGFTSGAALLIATSQLGNLLGIHLERGGEFFHILSEILRHIGDTKMPILAVGMSTLMAGILCRGFLPRIPYMIVALVGGTLVATLLDRVMSGGAGVERIGSLSASLPPLSFPDFSLETIRTLAPGVIAVTLLALTEAISIARAMALRSGQTIHSNQEFIAQGLSNLVGSFFSSYVATGSFNRSGLNYECGARTPLAAMSSGVMLIGLVSMVAPLVAYIPHAAMAGVLLLVAWGLIDWHHIHQVARSSRSETLIMAATFAGTLFFNLETAILFGVMLSLGLYLSRTSNPQVISRVPDPTHPRRRFISADIRSECPHVRILRIDGSLFFAAIPAIQGRVDRLAPVHTHLVLIASGINFIDLAGADFLAAEAEKRRRSGGSLSLVRLKKQPRTLLERGGYLDTIGVDHLHKAKNDAIHAVFSRLEASACDGCDRQVFRECPCSRPIDLPGVSGVA